jgi:hypothetical protein
MEAENWLTAIQELKSGKLGSSKKSTCDIIQHLYVYVCLLGILHTVIHNSAFRAVY